MALPFYANYYPESSAPEMVSSSRFAGEAIKLGRRAELSGEKEDSFLNSSVERFCQEAHISIGNRGLDILSIML